MKVRKFILTMVAAFCVPSVAFAQVPGPTMAQVMDEIKKMKAMYEARIDSLEKEVSTLKSEQKNQIMRVEKKLDKKIEEKVIGIEYRDRHADPEMPGGIVIGNPTGFGHVTVGGYFDHEFENFENRYSTFDQHRWIININAMLGERLRFVSEYEIEHGGPDEPGGGGEAKVEQAYVDYLINDAINFRAGAVLAPFGRYNIFHDSDLQDLTDRPLVNRRIIPTTWVSSGAGLFGGFEIGEEATLDYQIYMTNGFDAGVSARGNRGSRGGLGADNNNGKSVIGRTVFSPSVGHEVGVSGYWGNYNNMGDAITGLALDGLTSWGPLELVGEFAFFNVEDNPTTEDMWGFYLQANYHFWFDFLDDTFLGRTFDNPTFTFVSRYGMAEVDDLTDGIGNEERRITFGLNYRPVESWVLKLEYQFNDTEDDALEKGDDDGFIASVAMGF